MKKLIVFFLIMLLMPANISAYIGSVKSIQAAGQVAKMIKSLSKQGKTGEIIAKSLFLEFSHVGIVFETMTLDGKIRELQTNQEKARKVREHLLTLEGLGQRKNVELLPFIADREKQHRHMINAMIKNINQRLDGKHSKLGHGLMRNSDDFSHIFRDLSKIQGIDRKKTLTEVLSGNKPRIDVKEIIHLLKRERMIQIKIDQYTNPNKADHLTQVLNEIRAQKAKIPQYIIEKAYRIDMKNLMAHFSKKDSLQPSISPYEVLWKNQYKIARQFTDKGFSEKLNAYFIKIRFDTGIRTPEQITDNLMTGLWKHFFLFMDPEKKIPTASQINNLLKKMNQPCFDQNCIVFKGFFHAILNPGPRNTLTQKEREDIFFCIFRPEILITSIPGR